MPLSFLKTRATINTREARSRPSGPARVLGVVVAALFLVFGGKLTGWSLLVIVIVLAVYLGFLQLVAAWARKVSNPIASSGTAYGTP